MLKHSSSKSISRPMRKSPTTQGRTTQRKITATKIAQKKNIASKMTAKNATITKKMPRMISNKASPRSMTSMTLAKKTQGSRPVQNLYELFLTELHDLYGVENQIIEHLPTLIAMCSNQKLKEALNNHLQETKAQATRLRKIFQLLKENPSKHRSLGMEGVLRESTELLTMSRKGPTKDASIIAAAQKVEHYEICCYGTARAHAQELKLDEIAHFLKETLEEEVESDRILSKIAEGSFFSTGVNRMASEMEFALAHR